MKFTEEAIEKARAGFMEKPFWRKMWDDAPEKAKRRLEIAFWANNHLGEKEDLDAYRMRREEVEDEMTACDAIYLFSRFPEGAGKDHYRELAERKNLERRAVCVGAEAFRAELEEQGEGERFDYDDETKASILERLACDLARHVNDPLAAHADDVLETGRFVDAMAFPKEEFMHVVAEVRFRVRGGGVSEPCRLHALLDWRERVVACTLARGDGRPVTPAELGLALKCEQCRAIRAE